MLELAETIVRVTGSSSPIVFEALPVDDPQVRRPDITRAREVLGWEPEVDLDEGLRRWLAALGREPVVALEAGIARRRGDRRDPSSLAAVGRLGDRVAFLLTGIFDDAHILGGEPGDRLPDARRAARPHDPRHALVGRPQRRRPRRPATRAIPRTRRTTGPVRPRRPLRRRRTGSR